MHGLSAITQVKEHPHHDPQPFNAPGRGQMAVVNLAAATLQITILFFNGLITNDKFCLTRRHQLHLTWWRRPLRKRKAPEARA
jgi:hypothetical protein